MAQLGRVNPDPNAPYIVTPFNMLASGAEAYSGQDFTLVVTTDKRLFATGTNVCRSCGENNFFFARCLDNWVLISPPQV